MSRPEHLENLPIYIKATLIFQLVRSLVASLPE